MDPNVLLRGGALFPAPVFYPPMLVWRGRKGVGILSGLLQHTVRGPRLLLPRRKMQRKSSLRPGSSVVERGPEKAGVGGSIPSLATILRSKLICSRPRKIA